MDYFRAQDIKKYDVFTSDITSSTLNVSDYIYLLGMLKGTFDDNFEQKVNELTEKYHIPSDCVMNKLSPDMQLFVRVLASIAGGPAISVIDDVKELIDMDSESPLSYMINKYHTENKTAIIISGKEPPKHHNAVCYKLIPTTT
ncbi:MAG: hypothetical protein K0R46_376 [Herbinix sp.]|jgi:ABC-type multidrug transport system ATPase subunit|nr:hypothetical protein [Herbinix sp.]